MLESKLEIKKFLSSKSLIPVDDIDDGTKIMTSGIIRSLVVLELIVYLENQFSIEMSETDLVKENFEDIVTLSQLVDRLVRA